MIPGMSEFDPTRRREGPPPEALAAPQPVVTPRPPVPQPSAQGSAGPVSGDAAAARTEVSQPFADAPAAAIPPQIAADPELAARWRERERYMAAMHANPQLRMDTPEQQAAMAGTEAVRIRGTDSTPRAGAGGEGHIMATQMIPGKDGPAPGEHFSFYPAHPEERAARAAAGTPTERTEIGRGQPPFPTSPTIRVAGMPGALAPEETDHYLHQTKTENGQTVPVPGAPDKPQQFDHAFDPRFLDPAKFAEAVAAQKARQAELSQTTPGPNMEGAMMDISARDPQLMGVPPSMLPPDQAAQVEGQARAGMARDSEFRLASVPMTGTPTLPTSASAPGGPTPGTMGPSPTFPTNDPRVEPQQPAGGGPPQDTVQAQNCGTELMQLFVGMGMLGPADFLMLGGDKNGRFPPGKDLTPQQLNEHMRWREHEHMQRLRQQQQQQQQGGAPPPGGGRA